MVEHDTILRGLGARASSAALILQRTEDDFFGTTLAQLQSEAAFEAVQPKIAGDRDAEGVLRLYQPVHRTFHLALLELVCDLPGRPRLDPRKLDSAGLVIRRVARLGSSPESFPQAWLSVGRQLRGWQTQRGEQGDRDPDPLRRPFKTGGVAELARRALDNARLAEGAEQATPLFVAPPEVCERAGKTILFGLIPTASAEVSELPVPPVQPSDYDRVEPDARDGLRSVIPRFLRANPSGMELGKLSLARFDQRAASSVSADGHVFSEVFEHDLLVEFINLLKFLRSSLDAFGSLSEAVALRKVLARIKLPADQKEFDTGEGRPADVALGEAVAAMIAQRPGQPSTFTMPYRWPPISKELAESVFEQIKRSLAQSLSTALPGIARFDDPNARYELRTFARIKRDDGCPPRLIWSEPSEPFSIVPWFEAGTLPPQQIRLPDVTSKLVRAMRPNVAFRIPKRLFNFLNENDPKDLIDGKGEEGSEFGLDWICGFNISIIFVLAFIVMFIFLLILNIVFWWLPFIRICFPIPSLSRGTNG